MKYTHLKIWDVDYYDDKRKQNYTRYIWEFSIVRTHVMSHRLGPNHQYTRWDAPVPFITKYKAVINAKRFVAKYVKGVDLDIDTIGVGDITYRL